jgi:hypothetical protein
LPKQSELLTALFANIREQKVRRSKNTGLQAKKDALLSFMRGHQRAVEADLSPLVAVLSARQQGKSTGALLLAALRCLQKPGAQWVIIGLTRGSIQRIYWDALRQLNDAFELGLKFQEQRLVVSFNNGSKIHFFGADKLDEVEKLRGSRFHGAIIDECKSFPPVTLKLLIEDILGACLKGQAGQLYLIGTPGDVLSGEFYLATCAEPVLLAKQKRWSNLPAGEKRRPALIGDEEQQLQGVWSFHLWGPQTNDVVFQNERTGETFTMWEAFLKEKELRGWADDHPTWRREYLGHWVAGDGRLVYRYRPHLHDYEAEPGKRWGLPIAEDGWRTVLGIDFGTKDGTAMVVWAWHPHVPDLYELYSEKRKPEDWGIPDLRMSVKLIAGWYQELEREFGPFDTAVGDPAGLATMVMDTLASEHGVYVEPAEKKEKLDHIELFNDDLDANRIHVLRAGQLSEELLGNKWLEKTLGTPRRKEDPSTPNDTCDAALYAFRWCLHRQARPKPPTGPVLMTPDWYRQLADREREETIKKLSRPRDPMDRMDSDWWKN